MRSGITSYLEALGNNVFPLERKQDHAGVPEPGTL